MTVHFTENEPFLGFGPLPIPFRFEPFVNHGLPLAFLWSRSDVYRPWYMSDESLRRRVWLLRPPDIRRLKLVHDAGLDYPDAMNHFLRLKGSLDPLVAPEQTLMRSVFPTTFVHLTVAPVLVSALYGLPHLLGLRERFPQNGDKKLWLMACITVACVPIVMIICSFKPPRAAGAGKIEVLRKTLIETPLWSCSPLAALWRTSCRAGSWYTPAYSSCSLCHLTPSSNRRSPNGSRGFLEWGVQYGAIYCNSDHELDLGCGVMESPLLRVWPCASGV